MKRLKRTIPLKPRQHNLMGKKFGSLTVIENITKERSRWLCRCDCGNTHEAYAFQLLNGKSDNCGCLTGAKSSVSHAIHGMSGSPLHRTWSGMRQRCLNPNNDRWDSYGGRGIKICDRWLSFENFYADMGDRPADTSLDRIDNDKGYFPANCKWSSRQQQQNNMRSNVIISYNGEARTLANWASHLNLDEGMLRARYVRGWGVDRLFTPSDDHKTKLTHEGVTKKLSEWALEKNIDLTVLQTRYSRNWSPGRILCTPVKTKEVEYQNLEYNGRTQSLSAWCEELGLKRMIAWKRLKRGWSVADTFEVKLLNNSLKLKNIRKTNERRI